MTIASVFWAAIMLDMHVARCGERSGREDLNLRPPAPEAGALAGLRYAPFLSLIIPYSDGFVKLMSILGLITFATLERNHCP